RNLLSLLIIIRLFKLSHLMFEFAKYWVELPRREVFLAMKENEFYHPQEGNRLTAEQYYQIVFPYFVPTEGFIKIWESIS
ncbi:hypothetical protein APICBIBUN_09383, partial [Acinetobacter pittii 42F]